MTQVCSIIIVMNKDIIIASKNIGKIKEFKEMLEPLGYTVFSLLDYPEIGEIEETGKTFIENAIIKASTVSKKLNMICISDDSGLEISAFDGAPGIYSSRWLGEYTPYDLKMNYVIYKLENKEDRRCSYVCAIAVCDKDKVLMTFEEYCEGIVSRELKGNNGFGYDPFFYYEPYQKTIAELSSEVKNEISHRGKAIKKLLEWLENENI